MHFPFVPSLPACQLCIQTQHCVSISGAQRQGGVCDVSHLQSRLRLLHSGHVHLATAGHECPGGVILLTSLQTQQAAAESFKISAKHAQRFLPFCIFFYISFLYFLYKCQQVCCSSRSTVFILIWMPNCVFSSILHKLLGVEMSSFCSAIRFLRISVP